MMEERRGRDLPEHQPPPLTGKLTLAVERRWHPIAFHGGVLTLYTLLAIVVSWPLAPSFTSAMIGAVGGVDAYQCAWNLWWVADSLRQGQLPFTTALLYYPYGIDLFWQTLQFSQGVAALPITLLLGPLAGFNWTVLTSFVFGGYVTFLFARRVTGHTQAALVAGMIFAFSPYHMQKMVDGGLEVTAIQWLPCYCFALYMLLERPSWQRSLLSGALLLWVSLGSWYYGLFCVLTTACASLVWLLVPGSVDAPGGQQQRWRWPDAKRWISAVWGVTPLIWWGLVLAPRIIGLTAQPDALWDMRSIQADRSADLMDFFLPNPLHPLWGEALRAAREQLYPQAIIWNVSLGWVGLAFGLVGVLAAWGHARRWLALLLLTMLLAMGPTLRMFGHNTGLPLPFALIQNLPGIRSAQRPSHLAVIASLMLAILAAYGFAWLIQRLPTRSLRLAITAGALGLILAFDTYAGPMQLVSRTVDPFYATMPPPPAAAPGRPSGAVMPLPLYLNINRSENLTTQMVHHWPILGGYVARPPTYTFARYTPGVRELEGQLPPLDDVVSPGWPESGQRGLAAYAIRYITFDLTSDKDSYFARVRHHAELLQLGQPIFADTQLEVYEVPQTWPVGPIGYLGAGWQDLEQAPPYRWRWMGEQAELQLFNPQDYPVRATIEFLAASYQQDRPLDLRLDTNILAQINIPTDGPQMQHLSFLLEPGEHRVHLSAPATPDGQRSNMPISVRVFALSFRFTELGKGL